MLLSSLARAARTCSISTRVTLYTVVVPVLLRAFVVLVVHLLSKEDDEEEDISFLSKRGCVTGIWKEEGEDDDDDDAR